VIRRFYVGQEVRQENQVGSMRNTANDHIDDNDNGNDINIFRILSSIVYSALYLHLMDAIQV